VGENKMAMEDYVKITHKTEYGGHINTRRGVEHRGDIERKVTVVTSPLRTISKEYFLNGMPLPQKEGKRTVCSQVGSLPFLQIKREVKEAADVCFIEQVDFPFHLFICEHPKMSLDNRGEVFNAKRVLLTQGVDGIHNYDTEIEDINSLPLFYGIDVHNANEYFGNETHRNIFPRLKYPKRNFDAFYDARTKRTPYLTPELLCKV
jgi:hypothetical protein